MARMIREEGLEVMQSDLRKNKKINQIRTQKDTKGHKNKLMAAMDVFQRNSEDHVRYVRKNIQLAYMDSNL